MPNPASGSFRFTAAVLHSHLGNMSLLMLVLTLDLRVSFGLSSDNSEWKNPRCVCFLPDPNEFNLPLFVDSMFFIVGYWTLGSIEVIALNVVNKRLRDGAFCVSETPAEDAVSSSMREILVWGGWQSSFFVRTLPADTDQIGFTLPSLLPFKRYKAVRLLILK